MVHQDKDNGWDSTFEPIENGANALSQFAQELWTKLEHKTSMTNLGEAISSVFDKLLPDLTLFNGDDKAHTLQNTPDHLSYGSLTAEEKELMYQAVASQKAGVFRRDINCSQEYVTKKGDTVWSIAEKDYMDHHKHDPRPVNYNAIRDQVQSLREQLNGDIVIPGKVVRLYH